MKKVESYSSVFFDCDGVVLNSNRMKSNAFALALSGEDDELINEFVNYHQCNGGVSRFIKFEHYFKEIKKKKNYNKDVERAIENYAVLSKKGLLEVPEISGVYSVLRSINKLNVPCYVISGGEQQELREVFVKRNLMKYFNDVFGSPSSKIEILSRLKAENKIIYPGLYFGDSRSDYLAASKFNLEFVYIRGASEWVEGTEFCLKNGIDIFDDFSFM